MRNGTQEIYDPTICERIELEFLIRCASKRLAMISVHLSLLLEICEEGDGSESLVETLRMVCQTEET
jgi:hypothetical protein